MVSVIQYVHRPLGVHRHRYRIVERRVERPETVATGTDEARSQTCEGGDDATTDLCSMDACGSVAKARRYYQKLKALSGR